VRVGVGVFGLLVLLAGAVFAGQGLDYIPGSYMTGDIKWFWIGSAMVVIGLALGAAGFIGRPRRSKT
jgi:succinate dehydrogenase hydrophobic anchor subunit